MKNSRIEWTDHTFNPWVGCTKVSPACDHCYAESWAKRSGHAELWGGKRRRTRPANWRQPLKWNAEAAAAGRRDRVFCASLADVFDNEVPAEWRLGLFQLIETTPSLDWLLLTKRIGNVRKLCGGVSAWPNVWLGITVCNQEEADRDIPKLLATPARVRFLSIEPMLGPINLERFMTHGRDWTDEGYSNLPLDWVIVGGESGPKARPMHPYWARSLRDQCVATGVPFFFKQWGEWAPVADEGETLDVGYGEFHGGRDWVAACKCSEGDGPIFRISKKRAGRELDGRTWNEFPRIDA